MKSNHLFFLKWVIITGVMCTIFFCVSPNILALDEEIILPDTTNQRNGQLMIDSSLVTTVPFSSLQLPAEDSQSSLEQSSNSQAQSLVESLGSEDLTVQNSAYQSLITMGEQAEPALLEGLNSSNQIVRGLVIAVLGEVGGEGSLMALLSTTAEGYEIQDIKNEIGQIVEKRIVNNSGDTIKSIFLSEEGTISGYSNYHYSEENPSYSPDGGKLEKIESFDSEGGMTSTIVCVYNSQNKLIKTKSYNSEGGLTSISYINSSGKVTLQVMYGADGEKTGSSKYTYRTDGTLKQVVTYNAA
ncbi:MAG: hypothetical protein HY810_08665, partial [Candidatus Omnitrophica bacterium]|nr:hypothetical protein [Candidatus Omnitrophota bacterium]